MSSFVCVLDFEATCEDNCPGYQNEIIEFPAVLLKMQDGNLLKVSEFQQYIKPTINPVLTKFCTELTGITQDMVDHGVTLAEANKMFMEWLLTHVTFGKDRFMIWTCGQWDLKTCAKIDYPAKGVSVPHVFTKFVNVKFVFDRFYRQKSFGMTNMLKVLNIELEGRHHSGIDDCRNIAKIVQRMVADGLDPFNKKVVDFINVKQG